MSYIIQCDRCPKTGGQVAVGDLPQGWKGVGLYVVTPGSTRLKMHQFCPECATRLQLESGITEETSAERLVAILEAMVDEAVEERAT